jgi:putative YphP/YqiW family bacilliredoxin
MRFGKSRSQPQTNYRDRIAHIHFDGKEKKSKQMRYPEEAIQPMREELTRLGFEELRTPEAVDDTVKNSNGTVMLVVNSICGCAAGKARPGIALALQSDVRPDKIATVFAGADIEATERVRSYFTGYPPSSPSIGILRDGQLVYIMERYQIEGRGPEQIADELKRAFERVCAPVSVAS